MTQNIAAGGTPALTRNAASRFPVQIADQLEDRSHPQMTGVSLIAVNGVGPLEKLGKPNTVEVHYQCGKYHAAAQSLLLESAGRCLQFTRKRNPGSQTADFFRQTLILQEPERFIKPT